MSATNGLLTINMITREILRVYKNTNAFLREIEKQYDDSFAQKGAKIGSTLRIRLPNDYVAGTGKTITVQNTNEQNVALVVATQKNVPMSFGSAEMALSLDDFSKRIILPAVNVLAGNVAMDVMSSIENACNYVAKTDGSGNLLSPDAGTWLLAGAKLDNNSCLSIDRKVFLDPLSQARTVTSLAGLLNPQKQISEQYRTGQMSTDTLGFDWFKDQTVIKHTNGSFTAGTVNAGSQSGSTIAVNAITGSLNKGDIITFAGCFAVNRVTKASTGELQQFVVTATVNSGGTAIPIYPAMIPSNAGAAVAYQTVVAAPANAAVITLLGGANLTYRKNFALGQQAVTMATADLELPKNVQMAERISDSDVSMRLAQQWDVINDDFITRLDILYGYAAIRPEWIVCVPDIL
jgi:hypothetical protein